MLVVLRLTAFSPALGLAVADFLGATFGPLPVFVEESALAALALLFELLPEADFLPFFGLSDSEADEAELLVVLVVGNAFVLGLRDGAFCFLLVLVLFDFSSELLEEAELLELFFDLEESCELEESESLELSSLPEDDDEDELELELPDEELPEEAEDDALLEPARLGGIMDLSLPSKAHYFLKKIVCFYFYANSLGWKSNQCGPRHGMARPADVKVPSWPKWAGK